jgi:hypothetical protein
MTKGKRAKSARLAAADGDFAEEGVAEVVIVEAVEGLRLVVPEVTVFEVLV